jgi:hypothetical protein
MFRSPSLSSGQPRNRRGADIVAAPYRAQRLPVLITALDRLALLVWGEFRLSGVTEPVRGHSPMSGGLVAGDSFARARAD